MYGFSRHLDWIEKYNESHVFAVIYKIYHAFSAGDRTVHEPFLSNYNDVHFSNFINSVTEMDYLKFSEVKSKSTVDYVVVNIADIVSPNRSFSSLECHSENQEVLSDGLPLIDANVLSVLDDADHLSAPSVIPDVVPDLPIDEGIDCNGFELVTESLKLHLPEANVGWRTSSNCPDVVFHSVGSIRQSLISRLNALNVGYQIVDATPGVVDAMKRSIPTIPFISMVRLKSKIIITDDPVNLLYSRLSVVLRGPDLAEVNHHGLLGIVTPSDLSGEILFYRPTGCDNLRCLRCYVK